MEFRELMTRMKAFRFHSIILVLSLLCFACEEHKKNGQENAGESTGSAPTKETSRYVKSVQFVYPMKNDTCRYNEEVKIMYANNKRYPVDSAIVYLNQKPIQTLDSTEREFSFRIPATRCGKNSLKVIAFHPNNKQGVATQTFVIQPDKAPQRLQYDIIKTYHHAPDASTQGLVYHDGYIYEGTGLYGQSTLRKINLEQNKTLSVLSLESQYFGEGIAIYKNKIYQLTWTSRKGFVYDINTFSQETTFDYNTQGWGLTTIEDSLVMSDGSHKLFYLDPRSFSVLKTVEVFDHNGPVNNLNELEYINGKIWANVWLTDRIVVIDPQTGLVTEELVLPNLLTPAEKAKLNSDDDVLNGIAYNREKGTIYLTGKHWPKLFEIKIKTK